MDKNNRPGLAIAVILIIASIIGIGTWLYFADHKDNLPTGNQVSIQPEKQKEEGVPKTTEAPLPTAAQDPADITTEGWKTYRNEKYGFEFKYPSILFDNIDDTGPHDNSIGISRTGRMDPLNTQAFPIRGIGIAIKEFPNQTLNSAKSKLLSWNADVINLQSVFLSDDLVNPTEAIRYEFKGAPKQSPGGYSYLIVKHNREFDITFEYYANGVYDGKGNKLRNMYDPIGDVIMQTFRFIY